MIRLFSISVIALFLSGCATTSKTSPVSQMQAQVTEMQQRLEDQEKEIIDLKYEVKELGSRDAGKDSDGMSAATSAPAAASSGMAKPEPRDFDIIRVGGVTGRELQKALRAAGVYEGKIDGKVGSRTKAGVVEFQKAHSLKADGVVGQKTWSELKAYLNPPAEPEVKQ